MVHRHFRLPTFILRALATLLVCVADAALAMHVARAQAAIQRGLVADLLANIDHSLETVDVIAFSYDRPLQLYAFLESCARNITDIASMTVIYRTSGERFDRAYERIKEDFDGPTFGHWVMLKQESSPEKSFEFLVKHALGAGTSPYIMFAVDDIIVKNRADLAVCTRTLKKTAAYGFYLRLAPYLHYCYTLDKPQPLPPLVSIGTSITDASILSWSFKDGMYDWAYPHTVDMTIYAKVTVVPTIASLTFNNPNELEGRWHRLSGSVMNRRGLCFDTSVVINIPVNRVQNTYCNRHMDTWSTEHLLELFERDFKLDIASLYGIRNESCHSAYNITFVERNHAHLPPPSPASLQT